MAEVQTCFGEPHFSHSHANHKFGSTAPIQMDLLTPMPDGSVRSMGLPVDLGASGQTTLPMYGFRI